MAGVARRASWALAGQAISSGSNFLLSVMVLAVASAREFATFAVGLTAYVFVLQLVRATVGVSITLLYSEPGTHVDGQRAAAGVAVAAAFLAGVATLAGSAWAAQGRAQLVVLGLALPFLVWQDVARYACFADGRPELAAAADGLWLALAVAGSIVAFASGWASATVLLAVWAASGTVSAFTAGLRLGLLPHFGAAGRWLGAHRALSRQLAVEFLVSAGSHYAVYLVLAGLAGAGQLGRLKAAQTVLGPVVVLILGGAALGVPESVRAADDRRRLRALATRLSLLLGAGAVAWGAAAWVALPRIGPSLFPETWSGARALVPGLTLFTVAMGAAIGSTGALRAVNENAWLVRVRAVSGVALVAGSGPAVASFGAAGALAAVTAGEATVALLAWHRLVHLTAEHPSAALGHPTFHS